MFDENKLKSDHSMARGMSPEQAGLSQRPALPPIHCVTLGKCVHLSGLSLPTYKNGKINNNYLTTLMYGLN